MNFETIFYCIIWTVSVIYSILCFSRITFNYFRYYKDEYDDFTEGISFISIKRDKTDIEWEAIIFLILNYFQWVLLYLLGSQIIRYTFYKYWKEILKCWQILFTVIYTLIVWNYIFLLLLVFQPILFYIVRYFCIKKSSTWLCSLVSLTLLNYIKSSKEIVDTYKFRDYELYVLICSLFWMNLKCTSFYLQVFTDNNILNIFSYCLYPPTIFSGPFIPYKNFVCVYNTNFHFPISKYKKLTKNIFKSLFWFTFVYICLHFVYVNAAAYHPQFIKNLDSWSLYGFGYTMGQYFHLKYVIIYGISTSIASFEYINVPNLPRCIGRIHLYSDMWKYFDPGLYQFLLRNIYVPMAVLTQNKPIRSIFCFAFVYIWHGLESHIFIWTVMNCIGIIIENILWNKDTKIMDKKSIPEQNWTRRKDCFISTFLLAFSALSNFYFFAGTEIGDIFFKRIFTDDIGSVVLVTILYCCCQVSTELRTVQASKM